MTKNVLLLGCAYPPELPHFTRGVARAGARVFAVDQVPESQLPPMVRECLSGYCQVASLFDEQAAFDTVRRWAGPMSFDRVESLWEPAVLLAARLREAFGAAGMRYEQVVRFRDKDKMKQAVADAGLRTPRHQRAANGDECFEAAEQVGYPDLPQADRRRGIGEHLPRRLGARARGGAGQGGRVRASTTSRSSSRRGVHVRHDLASTGAIVYENFFVVSPAAARSDAAWSGSARRRSRCATSTRPELDGGRALGRDVLKALGHDTGFTHMEWYRKSDGEAVFGEIAARPPGAHTVDTMNFACDIDLFTGWAEAVVHGTWNQRRRARSTTARSSSSARRARDASSASRDSTASSAPSASTSPRSSCSPSARIAATG